MKRNFESMMILSTDIGDQAQEEIYQKITKKIETLDGKVLSAKVWAKERNLAFFLKSRGADKKKHTKGCYWLVEFSLDTDKLAELKETVRLEENILRSMILRGKTQETEKVEA
ncbi:MAG: 30S ribosomal protein S6 [Candidatus Omnitrophica bacterium]|nr:30S ribosomal protein S6 [Candidatus Omnitrophota bacterium]